MKWGEAVAGSDVGVLVAGLPGGASWGEPGLLGGGVSGRVGARKGYLGA